MKNRIRTLRGKKGFSQRQLAEALGTSQQQIQRYEMGSPAKVDVAYRLAEVLGAELWEVFPAIKAPLTKLKKRGSTPDQQALNKALLEGGVETDTTDWIVVVTFRGGMRRHYHICVRDKNGLEHILRHGGLGDKDDPLPFFTFDSIDYSITLNLQHVLACQFTFIEDSSDTANMDKSSENVRVWLTSKTEPLTFLVDSEWEYETGDDEVDKLMPFAAEFLSRLDDPSVLRFASFDYGDELMQTAHFQMNDIVLVEAHSDILHTWRDLESDEVEDDDKNSASQDSTPLS